MKGATEMNGTAFVEDVKGIIAEGMRNAYRSVHAAALATYWRVGRRIVEEEQSGEARARYGQRLVAGLSAELLAEFGESYSERNLRSYRQFYRLFPDFEIWNARVPNLTWTHFRELLPVANDDARYWYVREASRENWSAKQLGRNVGAQYYQRLLQSPKKEAVVAEMLEKTAAFTPAAEEFVKNPVCAEFLNLPANTNYNESELEQAILTHIENFVRELGRGFAFVSRQQHIATDCGDFFIDLVFYNYILKCFFLIDLKTSRLTHQDVGQMDMYVRMYDDLKRTEGDNPTIGLLLCADTSRDIARYSVLHGSKQLFAAKYLTYLPSEEEFRREIERQKEIFAMQHGLPRGETAE
jgi:predicted nuclease of restriction endonuclease-like (RecB) superfamily